MKSTTQIVRHLLRTEKGAVQSAQNKYFFAVERGANKIEIRKAVEALYTVNVEAVNTMIIPGKRKTRNTKKGVLHGQKPSYKKAVVTLATGETIDFFGEI